MHTQTRMHAHNAHDLPHSYDCPYSDRRTDWSWDDGRASQIRARHGKCASVCFLGQDTDRAWGLVALLDLLLGIQSS